MNENILALVQLLKPGNCSRGYWLRDRGGCTQKPQSRGKINMGTHPQQTLCINTEADASNRTHG